MTRADERLQRLLHAFPLMADEPQLTLDDLAARLGTDARTIRGDLLALERYDLPGGFIEAVTVEVQPHRVELLQASHFDRPQRLTRPELLAIELGLSMLAQEAPMEDHATIERAHRLVRQLVVPHVATVAAQRGGTAAANAGSDLVAVEPAPAPQLAALAVLQRAFELQRVVELDYRRAADTAPSARRVRPYAMVRADGAVYLVAWCERAEALRVFRLDRVVAATATSDAFTVPADFSLEQVMRDGHVFSQDEASADTLVVRYGATVARWIAEREGRALDADGTLTVHYPLADDAWAIRHVLQYGPDVELLAPPSMRTRLAEQLTRLLEASAMP